VKVRRRSKLPDLRKLPLDGVDMFLLSCLDGELSVAQLADITGQSSTRETERRVMALARLGLVEARGAPSLSPSVRPARPSRSVLPVGSARTPEGALRPGAAEDAITIRPPPPEVELDLRATLPAAQRKTLSDRITPLRPPSLDALFQAEPTGALLKLLEPGKGHPRESVKPPRRKR
jgi:hypothetical protein